MRIIRVFVVPVLLAVFVSSSLAGYAKIKPVAYTQTKEGKAVKGSGFLLKFDLSEIPSDQRIDLAELRMTVESDTAEEAIFTWSVTAVTGAWESQGAELTDVASIKKSDSLTLVFIAESGPDEAVEINITPIVELWQAGSLPNNGIIIQLTSNSKKNKSFEVKKSGEEVVAELSLFFSK